jgi:hypothetical protein
MQIMMQKMAIGNSSLSQTLCTLFYKDTASTAAKSGMERLLVRLTICGALKAEDATDFRQSFGNATNDGLYDRFLICPPPLKEKPVDNTWRARRASLEFGAGRVNDARTRQALEWQASAENEKARRARGRLQELALRVASVSASANDEDDISDECMQAAFRFCEWQERIRNGGYSPSQSLNIQAQLSESIIEAFVNLSAGRQIWVRWRDVHHNKNWRNRYGSVELNRSFAAALQLGEIEAEMKDGEKTGRYQLAEHFFPAPLEVVAEAPVERHPNG